MSASQKGLTLVELLVALLVFSFVTSAGVYALRLGVDARDQLGAADERLAEVEIARLMLKEDLAQIVDRTVRDEFGDRAIASFRGGIEIRPRTPVPGETLLMGFVRGGWANPGDDAPRSTLQYVEYIEKDGALVRRIRPFLDDARNQPRYERVLISKADNVKAQFLVGIARGELDWVDAWPVPAGGSGPPQAVSLSFDNERFGALTLYGWIGKLSGESG